MKLIIPAMLMFPLIAPAFCWAGGRPQAHFISHPQDSKKRIEFFLERPQTAEPRPLVVMIHGGQDYSHAELNNDCSNKLQTPGGKKYAENPFFHRLAENGYVVAAISVPGFGQSDGFRGQCPDFAGPFSQAALESLVTSLSQEAYVDSQKIALIGYSRGAMIASMSATRLKNLTALLVGGGVYDLTERYNTLPLKSLMRRLIEFETEGENKVFLNRSSLFHVDKISAATLIGHGGKDSVASLPKAMDFASQLGEHVTNVQLVVYPNSGHEISKEWFTQMLFFLKERLGQFE